MNKFTFALINEIGRYFEEETVFSPDTIVSELFGEEFGELEWMEVLFQLQMLYGVYIPDEIANDYEATIGQLSSKMSSLPEIPEEKYESYLAVCMNIFQTWMEYREKFENAQESKRERLEQQFQEEIAPAYKEIQWLFES